MSSPSTFGTQLIGQTENALNAILDQQLAGTGLNKPQWVALAIAVMSGGTIVPDQLLSRVAGALQISHAKARTRIDELAVTQLLEPPKDDSSPVRVTDAGSHLHARIRSNVAEITQRLWGDLPPDDLAAAARVLGTVLDRANGELAKHPTPHDEPTSAS
jgi:DNA-binding MarR family transcriptional regulator